METKNVIADSFHRKVRIFFCIFSNDSSPATELLVRYSSGRIGLVFQNDRGFSLSPKLTMQKDWRKHYPRDCSSSVFNLSGGTAQSGRCHRSISAEPPLNFAGRGDLPQRRTQQLNCIYMACRCTGIYAILQPLLIHGNLLHWTIRNKNLLPAVLYRTVHLLDNALCPCLWVSVFFQQLVMGSQLPNDSRCAFPRVRSVGFQHVIIFGAIFVLIYP